ncbi:hypothetical protein SAMD00019534_059680 [Acytostelium subglobosum LB1]|uniref:hypothetical protein n=1 Tax=Acytostelium subglobosum LB1 TaxID=1410327 RepID=UPI000644B7E3|nr:hypothetical protein SAMD00019534_059680 [Acytostelium subglobosum LB1]GAM22793.1 hypothetical protein SAMD00019534_059680 [Acytostelium subglobosum LB1]|eukprot:XP_012754020.1 hypothetical protein SAMD00019534_059680 [Acytostelium subglobosum LB1]
MDLPRIDIIKELLDQINQLYDDHRIAQAAKKLRDLDLVVKSELDNTDDNSPQIKQLLDDQYTTCKRFDRLRQESEECNNLLRMLENTDNWTDISNSDGIQTFYKDNGGGMHSIRMEGIVDSSLFDICSTVLEVDLYHSWIPRLKDATQLADDSRFRKAIYCRVSCPWPVDDRDIVVYGYGIDLLEESNKVVVFARSFEDGDFEGVDLPDVPTKTVRVDTKISGFVMQPISPTQTFVQVVSLTDPKMAFIPYWLLNFITNQFAHYLFVSLRRQTKSVASSPVYQERIKTNPLYNELKDKWLSSQHKLKE